MTDKTEPFFKQLYKLTHHIDTSISELHGKLEEKVDYNCDNSQSVAILHDTKKEVRQLKKEAQSTFTDFSCNGKNFGRILSACQSFIDSSRSQLNKIEEHLSSYGYTRQVSQSNKMSNTATETENEDTDENDDDEDVDNEDYDEGTYVVKNGKSKDITTPSPTKNKKPDLSKTPKLEDFGISSYGMQAMFRYTQNKQPSVRPSEIKDEAMEPPCGHYHNRIDSVPQAFQHNGLTVTPSIVGMFQWPPQTPDSCTPAPSFKKGLYYQNNTFSPEVFSQKSKTSHLESPVPPAFRTPGINQLNKVQINNAVLPQPSFTTDLDSPAPPVFQTPGMKYSGNIIKESMKHSELLENKVSHDYMLEEPELPELTMTFQDISQLTSYKNKKTTATAEEVNEPQKPLGLKAKFGYDADIATPPHLELLSSRLIKMGIAPSNSPYKTPPQPTLLSRYRQRGNQENIAP
ncbi:hypothetical protein LOTGIDRAFT_154483 [Lottia gigantea]|uniref:Uncharacterized protein n=1 Tax=Lottia gigantea TaxID=225164 RepID=V4A397_LOTGI|nr:hypothetical protein LOTGIDRAFT_154483 [Lottia gigantea]ESO89375.1 hypothetical protein LOTGIDRAFT_154483 [Lottia gigantea]